jgi:hypothetical protein
MANEELIITSDIVGTMDRPRNLDSTDLSGTEDISLNEIKLPRLCIAQGLSKQLVPSEGVYIKGLAIGEMYNDVTGEIYGSGPLLVVPILRHVTRIEFDPNNKGVPLDRNVPANDPRMQWTDNKPPRATEYVEFVSLLLRAGKAPEKMVVSIKTTNKFQREAAKLWNTFIYNRHSAIYTGLYTISSKIEKGKNKEGQETLFGVFIVKNAGYIATETPSGQALLNYSKEFHLAAKDKVIVTEREDEEGDTSFDTKAMDAEVVNEM